MLSLSDESKNALEANIHTSRDRNRNRSNTVTSQASEGGGGAGGEALPLGPGEWDEPLGIPICVVAQHTDKMANLERDHGWKDEQFDYVGQYVRTILLKHGGSLIYTMPSSTISTSSLQGLVHASLGITSTLKGGKGEGVSYEVSRREMTLVPGNWDSWAKIRMMADQFDPEEVSKMWSVDIQVPPSFSTSAHGAEGKEEAEVEANAGAEREDQTTATATSIYESAITNPKAVPASSAPSTTPNTTNANGIEVNSKDVQLFLGEQSKILEEYQIADRKERLAAESKKDTSSSSGSRGGASMGDEGGRHVEEHIGPVQFNMGGIQVDAEEMVKRIKVRSSVPFLSFPFLSYTLSPLPSDEARLTIGFDTGPRSYTLIRPR